MNLLRKLWPTKVKTKILLSITLIMLIMTAIPSVQFYRGYLKATIEQETHYGQAVYKTVLNALTIRLESMEMIAATIAANSVMQEHFNNEDRDALTEEALPYFKMMKNRYGTNIFQFHSPPATSFLRLHKPEKYGDDLSGFRHTVVAANKNKQMISGLEKGRYGLSCRAVAPVFYQGKHLGTVEVGRPLNDDVLQDVKNQTGVNISLVGRDGDGFKYIAKTHDLTIPEKMFPFLDKLMREGKMISKQVNKNNKKLVTTYGPIKDFSGNTIGVLAVPVDITGDIAHAKKVIFSIIATCLIMLLFAIISVYFLFARLINRPIKNLITHLEAASSGDLSQHVNIDSTSSQQEATSAQDEFTELSGYLDTFMQHVRTMVRDIKTNSENLNKSSLTLASVSEEMDSGATETARRAESVAAAAEEMSANMSSVAAATEEAAANVNVMTTATEEISSTVGEIQQSTAKAKNITDQAVTEAGDISGKVDELGSAAQDIGKVTETINEISSQTNLLALNATIEAARAGEAGKGFAVVANEIKDLAKQTAEATGEIKQRIEGIQNSTDVTVSGIRKITEIINEIDEIVTAIANALDEQAGTMTELTSNIQQAGEGISEVAENVAQSSTVSQEIASDVSQVNVAAENISEGTARVKENANELSSYSEELKTLIEKFKLNQ